MTLPTAGEIAQVQSSFEQYKASLDDSTQQLLEKFPGMLQLRQPGFNSAIFPNLSVGFLPQHQAHLEIAQKGDIDVLFMGDSITDWWDSERAPFAGKTVYDKHFGDWKIANFGIAGDTTQGVLYRLLNGEGEGFSPKVVMLLIGVNNTRTNSAPEIAEGGVGAARTLTGGADAADTVGLLGIRLHLIVDAAGAVTVEGGEVVGALGAGFVTEDVVDIEDGGIEHLLLRDDRDGGAEVFEFGVEAGARQRVERLIAPVGIGGDGERREDDHLFACRHARGAGARLDRRSLGDELSGKQKRSSRGAQARKAGFDRTMGHVR
jgi:hypothetical protein